MSRTSVRPRGFTLIELLVVVAIIALLISILLPSLACAREQAKAAKCGVQLRAIGTGMAAYFSENNDWIPGRNTTGINLEMQLMSGGIPVQREVLRKASNPVQVWDWLTPIIRYDTEMGSDRAERFRLAINRYVCASIAHLSIDFFFEPGLAASPDKGDFNQAIERGDFRPLSYLMPAHFQYIGQNENPVAGVSSSGLPVNYAKADSRWEAFTYQYRPQLHRVGMPARKIVASDALRYLDRDGLDFDVNPRAEHFGSFATAGAWWCGDESFGVEQGSLNWDGQPVTASPDDPSSQGRALALTYRHSCERGATPVTAQSNKGSINALFFDGHVARLDDRESRNIEFWYPKGAEVQIPEEGMTKVPDGFVIP